MAETMKGYVFKDVNDLRLEDRPIPTIQDPRDAIVRVALSSICASDFHIKVGAVPSANKDIILGHEFAGEVVAVGDACKKIKVATASSPTWRPSAASASSVNAAMLTTA